MPGSGLGGEEGTAEVDRENAVPLVRGVVDRRLDDVDAGVAHHVIQAAERPDRFVHEGLREVRIADVPVQRCVASLLWGR